MTGFGHPDWAKTHEAASRTSVVVSTLVEGGATCVGKTVIDELAYRCVIVRFKFLQIANLGHAMSLCFLLYDDDDDDVCFACCLFSVSLEKTSIMVHLPILLSLHEYQVDPVVALLWL